MAAAEIPSPVDVRRSRRWDCLAGLGLVLAVGAVYWNSLNAPFVFDDIPGIVRNATIRHLWPPWAALNPPVDGSGVSGRPLVNLSCAVNYALGGLEPWGYHVLNLTLHALAALTLWGVLRRTLRFALPGRPDEAAPLAWGATLLWAVHPLLTESVVCVVQRNEVMGGLFYLLTIYCFIRAAKSGPGWLVLSVLACLAGVASKETVATAPLLVLLYDRTFVAGTFRAAWQQRGKFYGALAATWLLLAWLMWHNRQRGGTVGFGVGVSSWDYLLTQCQALLLYLKLSIWPHPLVLDYGWTVAKSVGEVWWQGLVVLVLLGATLVALWRKPAVGFLGAWFFVILAPSSSFVPLATQTMAEHRMYLALAAPVTALVLALGIWLGRRALWLGGLLAVGLGVLTVQRNADYRTEVAIWTDTVAHCPGNARAHGNLGRAYLELGRWEEAVAACQEELRIAPAYNGDARVNIGRALTELGRPAEAVPYFEAGLRLRPDSFDVRNNFGIALSALGRWPEAVVQYEAALRLQPDDAELHNNLANALVSAGRVRDAEAHYATALRLRPDFTDAEVNWARALAEAGYLDEALPHFTAVVRARPDAAAHHDLARAFVATGRMAEATTQLQAVLQLEPDSAQTHFELAVTLGHRGRFAEAIQHDEAALRLQPDFPEAKTHLAWLRQQ